MKLGFQRAERVIARSSSPCRLREDALDGADGQHRLRAFAHNPLRDAAKDEAIHPGATVRSHHDKIRFEVPGGSDNRRGRVTAPEMNLVRDLLAEPLPCNLLELCAKLPLLLDAGLGGTQRWGNDHVKKAEPGVALLGKSPRHVAGKRRLVQIDRTEDLLEHGARVARFPLQVIVDGMPA